MPNDLPLFMRVPNAAVEPLFEAFRDQLEGAPGYAPPPAAPDQMQSVRDYLRTLTPAQVEAEFAKFRKRLAAPAPRAHDSMRALAVGGQHPHAAAINRAISPYGRF